MFSCFFFFFPFLFVLVCRWDQSPDLRSKVPKASSAGESHVSGASGESCPLDALMVGEDWRLMWGARGTCK